MKHAALRGQHAALRERVIALADKAKFGAVAVAFHDYESGQTFAHHGDRFFHAASTMKVAVLFAAFKLAEEGRIRLGDTLHVRNRFRSLIDGAIFRVAANRDGDNEVHSRRGCSMHLDQLVRAMITRSSNLATNLVLDYVGLETVQATIRKAKIEGVEIARGVEDTRAFEAGINNRVTANGLVRLFQMLCEGAFFRAATREQILEILLAQEFKSMIPESVPKGVRVAHKTGEISTVCHDAGIVFRPGRKPYVVAILTEMPAAVESRSGPVAAISRAIYETLDKK